MLVAIQQFSINDLQSLNFVHGDAVRASAPCESSSRFSGRYNENTSHSCAARQNAQRFPTGSCSSTERASRTHAFRCWISWARDPLFRRLAVCIIFVHALFLLRAPPTPSRFLLLTRDSICFCKTFARAHVFWDDAFLGLHTCEDVSCVSCHTEIGWQYVSKK